VPPHSSSRPGLQPGHTHDQSQDWQPGASTIACRCPARCLGDQPWHRPARRGCRRGVWPVQCV